MGCNHTPWSPGGLLLAVATLAMAPAFTQQKTGPGVPEDDSLTWHGITLYGVVDLGIQYDTHSAPFSPYRPAASGNIVRSNDYGSPTGLTPSNMGQSRVGLEGRQHLVSDFSGVFQVETFFNPQSGELADSAKSLVGNNGKAVTDQNIGVDGSSAGQVFQTAFVGIQSDRYGALTFGRQVSLLSAGMIQHDPNQLAAAFGLLGASNQYAGGGGNEDNRLDDTVKYLYDFDHLVHAGMLYKFDGSAGQGRTAYQVNIGGNYADATVDAYYSKVNGSVSAAALTATQVSALSGSAYPQSDSLAGSVSDNTAYALMASYDLDAVQLFAGYEHVRWANPGTPLKAGFVNLGGYILAFVTNTAYSDPKQVQVYWAGVRHTVIPGLDLTAAYYYVHQNAYGTGSQAGCSTTAHSTCSGNTVDFSFDADYRCNAHFDAYAGAMYSGVRGGMASGYLYSTDITPTVGLRYKF